MRTILGKFSVVPLLLVGATWALLAPGALHAQKDKPTFVVRMAPIENLMGDILHIAKVIGREGEVQMAETLLKNFTGGGGIEGLDSTKPWGVYGKIGPGGIDSEGVLVVPIADKKKFLGFLEKVGQKPEEKKGLYTLNIDQSPFPLFFRFEKGYLWGTIRDEKSIDTDSLPDTAQLLPASKTGFMSLTFDFAGIPEEIKKMVIGQVEVAVGQAKEKALDEKDPIQRRGQILGAEGAGSTMIQMLKEGGELSVKVDLNKTSNDLALEFSFEGKPGSNLAKELAQLGARKGVSGGFAGDDSAYSFGLNFGISDRFAKLLLEEFNKAVADSLAKDNVPDPKQKELALKVVDLLRPLIASGNVDLGWDIRGPGPNGKFNIIAGLGIANAKKIEELIRDVATQVPELKNVIQLDVAKTDKVTIHRIVVEPLPKEIRDIVGTGPILVGFAEGAIYVGVGSEGQKNIEAQAAKGKTTSALFAFDVHMARAVTLMAKTQPEAIGAARKAFDGKSGQDLIEIKVASGGKLVVKLSMKTQVLAFLMGFRGGV